MKLYSGFTAGLRRRADLCDAQGWETTASNIRHLVELLQSPIGKALPVDQRVAIIIAAEDMAELRIGCALRPATGATP